MIADRKGFMTLASVSRSAQHEFVRRGHYRISSDSAEKKSGRKTIQKIDDGQLVKKETLKRSLTPRIPEDYLLTERVDDNAPRVPRHGVGRVTCF
jgi:hypothetical protein